MEQVLVCLKKNGVVNIGVLDTKRRELYSIGKALIEGDATCIAEHIEKALDSGASVPDILEVAIFVNGNKKLMISLIELIKTLEYEESKRESHITILNDVREEI